MSKFWKLSLLLSLLLLNTLLFAQSQECIDFEHNIEPGTYGVANGYTPGSTLFTDEAVIVKLQPFHYSDSTSGFLNATITDDEIFNSDGSELLDHEYIFPSNINLHFDFTRVEGQVNQVSINFIDGGGVENLSVNGSPIRILENFLGLSGQEIAPGVIARIAVSNDFDFPAGTLYLTGAIDSLVIGGQELALDEVCFRTEEDQSSDDDTCSITNFRAEVLGCNATGSFNLRLNFTHQLHSSDSFFVIFRGETLGRFAISQLPLTLGNLRGDDNPHLEDIKVCFPIPGTVNECCVETEFMLPNCQGGSNDTCSIRNLTAEVLGCNPNGTFRLKLNFTHQLTASDSFFVRFRGEMLGRFAISQLPLTLENLRGDDTPHLEDINVCFANGCCAEVNFMLPNCQGGNNDTCSIRNLTAEVLGCNTNGTFRLRLNFSHQLVSGDSFFVQFRGASLGRFSVSQLPLTLENLRGDDNPHLEDIKVCFPIPGTVNECCVETEFMLPDCQGGSNDTCSVRNLTAEVLGCNTNGTFRLRLNFSHQLVSGDSFFVQFRGVSLGRFSVSQLPLTLENLRSDDNPHLEDIKVCLQNRNCCVETSFMLPDCQGGNNDSCSVRNLTAEVLGCNTNGTFRLRLNFSHQLVSGDSFFVQFRGASLGRFSVSQLPLTLENLRGDDNPHLEDIKVCLQNRNCCVETEFMLPDCQGNNDTCALRNARFSDLECIPENRYRVTINFDHKRTGGSFVLQSLNGYRDTFSYAQLPLRLPIPRANDSLDILSICDLRSPNCCTRIALDLPCRDSSSNNCNIQSLTAVPTRCADGKFLLNVSFRAQNTGALGYLVFVDGQIFGPFRYTQTSVVLGPFAADGVTIYDVLVLDLDDPTCYDYTEIRPVRCEDNNECNISNFRVDASDCNPNGTFNLRLNFTHQLSVSDSFFVRFRGDTLGRFAISQLPITLENLRGDDNPHLEDIKVCFANGCCAETTFQLPDCRNTTTDTCRIYNIVARTLPCDSIGRFYVKLKFESEHTGSGGFSIRGNGRVYGNFRYSQDSILLGPLQGNGSTVYEFVIQDNEKPTCRDFIEIGPIACEERVWPGDANVNNRADHIDLLNIGIAYGAQGPVRSAPTLNWQEQRTISWGNTFADGINYAHADCNGDGVVNLRDREAIARNYGLTHGAVQPVTPLPGTNLDPPIFVDLPDTSGLPAGLAFTAPLILGTANNFVENIYGIAFTVEFNPRVIDPASIQISYPKSWFGTENSDFISFHEIDTAAGLIHIAVTRIDQRNVSGFGAIALISGVIDDIAGIIGETEVKVSGIQAINLNQQLIPLHAPAQMLKVETAPVVAVGKLDLKRSLRIMPNPTNDWVQIFTKYYTPVHSIEILDANGKSVGQPELNTNRISLAGLPKGIYILRIQIGEYVLNERVVKM